MSLCLIRSAKSDHCSTNWLTAPKSNRKPSKTRNNENHNVLRSLERIRRDARIAWNNATGRKVELFAFSVTKSNLKIADAYALYVSATIPYPLCIKSVTIFIFVFMYV